MGWHSGHDAQDNEKAGRPNGRIHPGRKSHGKNEKEKLAGIEDR